MDALSHITFIVRDLDRTEALLTTVFKAEKVYDSGEQTFSLSKERFFLIGNVWVAIMEGEPLSDRTYNHVAFKIEESMYDHHLAQIRSLGLDLREARPRVDGEGRSIYFYDFDSHLFELHTGTLQGRLAAYARSRQAHNP